MFGTEVSPLRPAALLALLALVLFLVALGATGLSDPDEPYYAVPALEMMRTGTWTITLFHGQPWFDKPILFYWLVLGSFHLLGVSETTARLASALAGTGGVLALFALGRRAGLDANGSFASGLVLATSLEYALLARSAVTDMTLTCFITLGMLAAALYLESGRARHAALAGAAFGLATLTKGPVGLLLPGVALAAYAGLARRRVVGRALLAGACGAALTAAPWYVYMALTHRDLLLKTFLGEGNLGRFVTPEHRAFPLYYVAVLAAGLLPWSAGLPAALLRAARRQGWVAERGPGRRVGPLFALCWLGAVLLVFSLSASKLPTYVLPAFPPAALLIAEYWGAALRPEGSERLGRSATVSAGLGVALAIVVAAALVQVGRKPTWIQGRPGFLIVGSLLLAGSLASCIAARYRRPGTFLACGAATAIATLLVLVLSVDPRLEPFDSTRPLVRQIQRAGLEDQIAGAYHVSDVSLDFYLRRSPPRVTARDDLLRQVTAAPGGVWIVRTRSLDELIDDPGLSSSIISRGPYRSAVRLAPVARPEGS
jgi:4-amino-4-deoxy-L-arabinose transferase-like glycosyltransferase